MENKTAIAPDAPSRWGVAIYLAVVAGTGVAFFTVPFWVPALAASLAGAEPKVYWYLSRASAFTAFALLWFSMASGLVISNKVARIWPGAFTAFDLHQYTSLLGLGFAMLHVLALLGDKYIGYNVIQLFIPFANAPYRPVWVGLGQVALYLWVPVTFTFYIRKQIGNRTWHLIHYLSYAVFIIVLLHGLGSGTDGGNIWVRWTYWFAGISLLALTLYRLIEKQVRLARQD